MGSLYKRGGIWYLNAMADGRRIRRRVGRSKRLAEIALRELEAKIVRKELDLDFDEATLGRVFDKYIEYSEINHSQSTTLRYNNVITNFKAFLKYYYHGKPIRVVSDLSPAVFEDYKRYRRTVDPKSLVDNFKGSEYIKINSFIGKAITVNYEIKTLRSIFNWAIKHQHCRVNPTLGVPMLKIKDSKRPRFLTSEECRSFLDACDESQYPIFLTFLNTGLRLGEAINLQWADIDLSRKKLMVQSKEFWVPKAGEREIPLNQKMIELFESIRPRRCKITDFVFPGPDGGPCKRKLRQDVIRISKRAGLVDVTKVHTFRHTFASHLVMKGVDLPTVQRLLGHSDIQTTMIYAHLAPEHLAGAVDKLKFE